MEYPHHIWSEIHSVASDVAPHTIILISHQLSTFRKTKGDQISAEDDKGDDGDGFRGVGVGRIPPFGHH
jgi:hypothetical protein